MFACRNWFNIPQHHLGAVVKGPMNFEFGKSILNGRLQPNAYVMQEIVTSNFKLLEPIV